MSHTDSSDACAHRGWSTIKRRYGGCILALSLAASILSVVTLRPGQAAASPVTLPVTFTVPAGVAWTDTGDTLTPGKLVTVLASGTIGGVPGSGSPAGSPSPACLPATDASLYGPIVDTALNCWSLMGRFGASGQPFEIGASPTFMAQAGEFYLGVNDNKFSDNTGSWSAQVTSGTLAQALAIGQHDASRYSAGCTHKISPKGTDPVDCASGDFYDTFTDVSIPGRGPGLDLTRTYNSMAASNEGIFGYGWTCSYESSLVVNADSSVTITEADGSQVTATPNGSGGYTLPSWADSTLVENGGGTYTFVRQQTQIFTYSASGQLTSISDPNGYATTLGYTSGKLTTVTDAAGRALTFAYGTNGLVSSVTDPMSRETQYGYDTSGELTSVTDPLGRVTSFTYDSAGQHFLLTLTVPNGQSGGPDAGTTYTNTYDSVGQVLTQTDAMGQTTTYAYAGNNFSSSGGTTTITSPQGDVDVESYTNGELTSDTNGYGTSLAATTSYAYDATSLGTTSVTDPNGHTTTNTYDADGNLLTTKDALGNTTTYTYNALNEPLTITKPSGLVTTNTYDADGNLLTSSTTPAGASGSPYTWASADADGADGFNGVSCPSVGLCVGVDRQDVVVSTDPTGGASAWTSTTVDTSTQINAVSCPSTTLCLAADADGNVLSATNPTGSVAAWHYTDAVDYPIASISCPSTTLCVAVDTNGDVLTATNPASGPWSVANIDALAALDAVSCASSALCVAADNYGHVFTSTNPTGGASAWHSADVDGTEPVRAVDCPSVALCVAGDGDGHVLSATNPTGGASAWSSADVDGTTALLALSCPSAALCWASDATGHALVSTQPSAGASAWSSTDVDGSASISGLSCPSGDVCAGVDNAGHALSMTGKDPTAISLYANASDPGVVTETIDPAGHVTTYGYDSYGDTTSTTTHPTAQQSDTTQDVYDADGELVCEASPPEVAQGVSCPAAGSSRVADTLTWNYDADGEVTAAINADGQQTSTTYDADGNVVTVTDPVGNVTKDTYDADDRLTSTTTGYGTSTASTTSDAYDIAPGTSPCSSSVSGAASCSTVTNGLSQVTVDYDNVLGQEIETVAPGSLTTTYTYDGVGNPLTTTTAAGTTTDGYDADNRLTSITYSATASGYSTPHNVTYTYNSDGVRTQMTDGTGTTTYTPNGLDELTSVQNGAGATVAYTYDLDGNVASITYPNGKTASYTYDLAGNMSSVVDFQGRVTNFSTDLSSPLTANGSQAVTALPDGAMSVDASDAAGEAVVNDTIAPDASTSSAWTVADADGTDGFNAISCPSTSLCIAVDRQDIVHSTSPTGGHSAWHSVRVDTSTQIEGISCPSTTLCVAVDAGGNVLTSTSPTSGSWTTANIDPYTALNSVSCPSTTLCVATDVNGDVFTTTNPTGGASAWTEHNVEGTGSFLTVACATTSLCLLTDDVGNVLTSTAPTSGAWSAAAIDPGVALSQASCVSASLCLIGDAHGDVVFSTNPTGGRGAWSMADVDGTISLDALSCPSSALCVGADGYGNVVTTTSPTAAQGSLSYSDTNNADGNITTETDAANGSTADSVTYGYTANVQVSSSSASGIPHDSGSFAYDTAAEPTTIVNPSSGASDTQSFNSADELTSSVTSGTTTTYAEDSIGARTSSTVGSGSPSAYSYNQIGELVSAVPSGGSTYTYAYNGDGLRMSKTVSSTTESYTWDPISGNLLVDGSTNFLYGPNGVVEQEDGTSTGDPLYFVQDSQGSTRALLNQSGAVAGTYSYDTYGAIASHSGSSSTPIGYVGAYSDTETDFLYLVNRYYDPATGQFLSVDSLVDETGQPYAYTGDDPVNGVDPLGLCTVKGEGQLYPGACATTGAEAIAAEQEIQAQAGGGGFSITNGLKALANYGAGIGNGIVSTATFGQVHISAPYCNSLSWAYGVGSGFGYAIAAVGGGAAASAAAGSTTVGDLAYGSQSLGPDSALFGNDTLGETADSGLLNQRGSTWKVGWSVDATVSPTSPGFRISTPFIDHWWITHASGF